MDRDRERERGCSERDRVMREITVKQRETEIEKLHILSKES